MNENPYRSPEPVAEEKQVWVPWLEKNLTPEKVCWRMGWAAVGLRWLWWSVFIAAVGIVPAVVAGMVWLDWVNNVLFCVVGVPFMVFAFSLIFFAFMPVRVMGNASGWLLGTYMLGNFSFIVCGWGVVEPPVDLGEHGRLLSLLVAATGFWLSLVPFTYFLLDFAKKMENEAYIARAVWLRKRAVGATVCAAVCGAIWAAGAYGFFPWAPDRVVYCVLMPPLAVGGLFYALYTLPMLAAARRWVRETFTVENLREKGEFGEFVE